METSTCFNSRPSCDGRPQAARTWTIWRSFNSRPSCDGRPIRCLSTPRQPCFNSRPSCDGRQAWCQGSDSPRSFNSRPSCDGRQRQRRLDYRDRRFNSRPSCDGRLCGTCTTRSRTVSIHARLATGDRVCVSSALRRTFQFTPVLRRATIACVNLGIDHRFNSRPSCDGRLREQPVERSREVSIHARLATGDS